MAHLTMTTIPVVRLDAEALDQLKAYQLHLRLHHHQEIMKQVIPLSMILKKATKFPKQNAIVTCLVEIMEVCSAVIRIYRFSSNI